MKKNKFGSLFRLILTAAVLLVMIPASVFAASDEGDFATKDDGSGGVVITDYNGPGGAVEIPAAIGGKKVTSIGDYAFQYCSSPISIKIPDSVISIGKYAFYECDRLTSVMIPDSVTSIGDGAFSNCIQLISIKIPDSVTSIGDNSFHFCARLTSIMIPDSVTTIKAGAFLDCYALADIYYTGTEEIWKSMTQQASVPEGATVHYMKFVDGQAAACTEDGWRSFYECNDCGVLYDGEKDAFIEDLEAWKKGEGKIAKLAHKAGEWQKDDNGHWMVCERCGEKLDAAAEHTYGEWSVVTEAEGDTEGLEKRVCTVCGHEQTRVITAPGSDPAEPEENGDEGQAETGDDSSMLIWIILMAGALAGTGLILRRRRHE